MGKKIVIIDGHPDGHADRLCHALARAYGDGAQAGGHEVRRIDVTALEFPLLRSKQDFDHGPVPPDIQAVQKNLIWADHMLMVYPLWLGTMPALLKAFLEQLFRPDFAFERQDKGWPRRLLKGRSARIIVTMGMPALAYRWLYGAHSLKSLERNILKFAGISPVRENLFGLVDAASDAKRRKWLEKIESLGRKGR